MTKNKQMKIRKKRDCGFILASVFLIFLINGCSSESVDDGKIKVVATIEMITDMAENIGGDKVIVQGLMGPGIDPHLYKATEGDVTRLARANLIFYNGLHLEARMGEILEKMNEQKTTVAVSDYVSKDILLDFPTYPGQYDPHIWFDVSMWISAAEKVRDTYIEYDPENKEGYSKRAQIYINKLKELDKYVRERAAEPPKSQRILVTAHDAFQYFGRAYDFEVVGLQGISTAAEAGTKDVQELVDFIIDNEIKAIFIETSISERTIKAVQESAKSEGWDVEIGGELFSDAMGDEGTFEGTYIGMVTHNIDTIVSAIK